jgi:hypothetical protein
MIATSANLKIDDKLLFFNFLKTLLCTYVFAFVQRRSCPEGSRLGARERYPQGINLVVTKVKRNPRIWPLRFCHRQMRALARTPSLSKRRTLVSPFCSRPTSQPASKQASKKNDDLLKQFLIFFN